MCTASPRRAWSLKATASCISWSSWSARRGGSSGRAGAIEEHLDRICLELYPDGGPYYEDDTNTTLDWRVVGVTARMVLELCRLHEIPVHILWHDHVVESFTPASLDHDLARQALHIRGGHAYFYKDPHPKGRWPLYTTDASDE